MRLRKRLFGWCPQPVKPISTMLRRYSTPLAFVLTTAVLLVSFFLLSSGSLVNTPPSIPEVPVMVPSPSPTLTPFITVSPAPSQSPLPSPSPSPTLAPWPASKQPPPDRSAETIATSSTSDPIGDNLDSKGTTVNAPGYTDIVYAEVAQISSTSLQFSMKLAAKIPAPYSQSFFWGMDTDMNSSTGVQNNDIGVDRGIRIGVVQPFFDADIHSPVAWITQSPAPYHDARDIPEIPWSQITVSESTITVTISLSDIGYPTSFYWVASTTDIATGFYDYAPNSGHVTLTLG